MTKFTPKILLKGVIIAGVLFISLLMFSKIENTFLSINVSQLKSADKNIKTTTDNYYKKRIAQLEVTQATAKTSNNNTTIVDGMINQKPYHITVTGIVATPKNNQVSIYADQKAGHYFASKSDVNHYVKSTKEVLKAKSEKESIIFMMPMLLIFSGVILVALLVLAYRIIQLLLNLV